MSFLNSREWAIVIWSTVILVFLSFSKASNQKNVKNLLKTFLKVTPFIILILTYIACTVFILYRLNLWEWNQLKNTIIWTVSFGFLSIFKLESIEKGKSFFVKALLDNFKLFTILQFLVGLYTFNFFLELVFIPIISTIAFLTVISEHKKIIILQRPLNKMLALIGIVLILLSILNICFDFGKFATINNLLDFAVTPLLTLLFIPFIFLTMIYSSYRHIFSKFDVVIKSSKIKTIAKILVLFSFNIRLDMLNLWSAILNNSKFHTLNDVCNSIKQAYKFKKAEKHPVNIPIEKGWSPYKATKYLKSEGLSAGYYLPLYGIWSAISSMKRTNDKLISNNISYYIEGDEKTAKTLKLLLNVNSNNDIDEAHRILLNSSRVLHKHALNSELPNEIRDAILKGVCIETAYNFYSIAVKKEYYRENVYSIYFIISNISSEIVKSDAPV